MPGQYVDKYTWLGSGFTVDFTQLDIGIGLDSLSYDPNKQCVCLGHDPDTRIPMTAFQRVRCEKAHYILCDQWKGKIVKNSLL